MADKVKEHNQYIRLKAKYIGLGNPDTTREEFLDNVRKDTYASLGHHQALLLYNSIATGTNREVFRQEMIKKMLDSTKRSEVE